jgi:hypothetical protein
MTRCGGAQVRSTRAEQVRNWKCHVLAQVDANPDERHGDVMAGQHAFRVWALELNRSYGQTTVDARSGIRSAYKIVVVLRSGVSI